MANISLESSIRTCKIDPAYAPKVFSDRFLNPGKMVCPVWTGYDSVGRPACPDSYMTKSGGCNSAMDRVAVENHQRPRYVEYVNLNAGGIAGEFYDPQSMNQWDTMKRNQALYELNNTTGNFGMQLGANVYPGCGVNQYSRAMAQEADKLRNH